MTYILSALVVAVSALILDHFGHWDPFAFAAGVLAMYLGILYTKNWNL